MNLKPVTIKIASTHKTLADAVAAANIDLSYNESAAQETIQLIDRGYNRDRGTTAAFVCEDGKVRFVYQADIALLNEFSPFSSGLDSTPFELVEKIESNLNFTGTVIPKNREGRKLIRNIQSLSNQNGVTFLAA